MRLSKLIGARYKETPSDCQTANHIYCIRGGYMKHVGSGIYSLYNPMKRVTQKIEAILRDEMDKLDGQEVMFPVVMPATLWQESGRYESIGSELLRFSDRSGAPHVLGMTHEEASVQLVKDVATSYQSYPFMIYQIQTKFRDEPRTRGGLIRVREFTMKDAYSFHTTWEDLREYYDRFLDSYNRIFARAGMPGVVAVQSDSGMMGGSLSHEFMFLSDIGEDTIVRCEKCGFIANMEATECIVENAAAEEQPLTKIATPGVKTIEDLCNFVGITAVQTSKAVIYQRNSDDSYVAVFIRGDLDVNETKLRNYLGCEVHPAVDIDTSSGLIPGSIGPVGLSDKITIVCDRSTVDCKMLYCGANEDGYHYSGLSIPRDLPNVQPVDIAKAAEGGICPECGNHGLSISRGVEVGNIFQLGTKYSESMQLQYADKDGELKTPIMGSYGIGVGRLAASIIEAYHDDYGPIWPMSVAPWQLQICVLNTNVEGIADRGEKLYSAMQAAGIEVLYDDRAVSAGSMFSDADLLGCPLRIVISKKTSARDVVEFVSRDKTLKTEIAFDGTDCDAVVGAVKDEIAARMAAIAATVK